MLGVVLALALLAADSKDHFVWPKELFPLNEGESVMLKIDLPQVVDDTSLDGSAKGRKWPIVYVDLNGDGKKEMIAYLGLSDSRGGKL